MGFFFCRHQLNANRQYGRRSFEAHALRDVFVPPHLYGQLSVAKGGLDLLEKDPAVNSVVRFLVEKSQCGGGCDAIDVPTPAEWVRVKACMWAVAHIALSARGAGWVDARGGITALVDFAEKCSVFSLKATAFYAIGQALFLDTWLGTHTSTMSRDVPDIHGDRTDFCQWR